MSAYLKYIGKDKGIIPGIPARDLEEKEAQDIGVAHLLQSGLYVRVAPPYAEIDMPKIDITFENDGIANAERKPIIETKQPAPEEEKPTKRKRARKE